MPTNEQDTFHFQFMFKHSSFTDRSKAVFTLWIDFCYYISCLYLLCYLVCSLQPCDHLLGMDLTLGLLSVMFPCVFVTFPYGVPGSVVVLIQLIPELCLLLYFENVLHVYSRALVKKHFGRNMSKSTM